MAVTVDSQRKELLGSRLLGVTGEVQREGEVVHVLARRLEDHTHLLGRLSTRPREFHVPAESGDSSPPSRSWL